MMKQDREYESTLYQENADETYDCEYGGYSYDYSSKVVVFTCNMLGSFFRHNQF